MLLSKLSTDTHATMGDNLLTTAKALVLGASLTNPAAAVAAGVTLELLSAHYSNKMRALLDAIVARLVVLENTGSRIDLNLLFQTDDFRDLLLVAFAVAERTRRKEKLDRIKNATAYCAYHRVNPHESDSFLHLLDQLTEEHFVILTLLADNTDAFKKVETISETYAIFHNLYPNLSLDVFGHYLYDLKYRRLVRLSHLILDDEGLMHADMMSAMEPTEGPMIVVTEVAKQLLHVTK